MPREPLADVVRVVEAHREATGRAPFGALLDEHRAIVAALARGNTAEELEHAVKGAALSAVNRARGRREIAWILASDARIASCAGRYRETIRAPRPPPKRRREREQDAIPIFDEQRITWAEFARSQGMDP